MELQLRINFRIFQFECSTYYILFEYYIFKYVPQIMKYCTTTVQTLNGPERGQMRAALIIFVLIKFL
jgi:hypothetical protein